MNSPEKPNPDRAVLIKIDERHHDQRLDNFLAAVCKGVPKTHIFRIIRSGEVRINKKRAEAKTRVYAGDEVRIPPIETSNNQKVEKNTSEEEFNKRQASQAGQSIPVLFEDDGLLVVNKPSGLAVHGGSGQSHGLIECLRALRANTHVDLELVHRIDRETSGVLVVSKKRSMLRRLQEQLRQRSWKKFYLALVKGAWPSNLHQVDLPLLKTQASEKEARVFVSAEGDHALTKFKIIQRFRSSSGDFTLIQANILTGRTHQIRVHTSASGFPIVGDDRYGDFELNKIVAKLGLKRMFLHAARLGLIHPATNEPIVLEAPLAPELERFLHSLQAIPKS
ncbi:RluA family pseudouridine synthase [Limnobacter humi]|uniref:Pseudouridine synthase n=1 Tax=Limnobacter humi TaxID=1778671 RepID=A0ABT1WG79_9BURK|nr:RluA family pseudouridine synthase [Limnobacter humi]